MCLEKLTAVSNCCMVDKGWDVTFQSLFAIETFVKDISSLRVFDKGNHQVELCKNYAH